MPSVILPKCPNKKCIGSHEHGPELSTFCPVLHICSVFYAIWFPLVHRNASTFLAPFSKRNASKAHR